MFTKKVLTILLGGTFALGVLTGCSANSQTKEKPKTASTSVKEEDKFLSKNPQAAPEIKNFNDNPDLSAEQNKYVKEIMVENGYDQKTAEIILSVSQTVCNLLEGKPESDQKTLADIYKAVKSNEGGKSKEWYKNIHIATVTMCPEKTKIVEENKPAGV